MRNRVRILPDAQSDQTCRTNHKWRQAEIRMTTHEPHYLNTLH